MQHRGIYTLTDTSGALPCDFINYVKSYYADTSTSYKNVTAKPDAPAPTRTSPNIDRPFLEHVWKWLIKHPEIQIGDHVGHKQLTLSEVEARNAAIAQGKTLDSATADPKIGENSATPQGTEAVAGTQDGGPTQVPVAADVVTSPRRKGTKESVQANKASGKLKVQEHLATSQENQVGPANKSKTKAARAEKPAQGKKLAQGEKLVQAEKPGTRATPNAVTKKCTSQPGIRLYTSQNRMWYAITGHGPDESRVKSLDFICLSVIAASGPKGILQHNLISITGQDKRSLPSRTDRLRDDGYIVKERETTWFGEPRRRLHTSRCTLTRYVKDKVGEDERADPNIVVDPPVRKKKEKKDKRVAGATQNQAPIAQQPPPVPQWTSDRPVANQIFDLVRRSGIQGMSASVSKRRILEMAVVPYAHVADRSFERICSARKSRKSQKTISQGWWKAGR